MTKASCIISFDGYLVLAKETFTLNQERQHPIGKYHWRFPIGLGAMHFITVSVEFYHD